MKIIVVGAGKVGCNLSRLFASRGTTVVLFEPVRPLAEIAPMVEGTPGIELLSTAPATAGCSLVVLAVPDDAIGKTAGAVRQLAGASSIPVVHCAGAASPRIEGVAGPTGIMHPAFSFPEAGIPLDVLAHVAFLVEGDLEAVDAARALLEACELPAVVTSDHACDLYHAGCVTASNFLPLLGLAAGRLFSAAGLSPEDTARLLSSLMQGALANGLRKGFESAITGPAARGDKKTILAEAAAVARTTPDFFNLFLEGNIGIARLHGHDELEDAIVEWVENALDDEN